MEREAHVKGYKFLKFFLAPIFRLYYNPTIIGKENIPKDGPVIFCGNHIHLYDQCLAIVSTKRMIHYMAKKEYFDGKMAWFFKMAGCISVNRSIHDEKAKEQAINILDNGYALGIFPEGTRNKTKEVLQPFKFGAVSMAQKTGAYVIPFAITGKYKFRNNLTVCFGKPFKIKKDMSLDDANEKLWNNVLTLIKENKKD